MLKNYRGPQLTVSGTLSLQAEDLMDLASVLRDRGELSADDGYGRDVSGQVSWRREKVSTGIYDVTFSLTNAYLDSAAVTVRADISGKLDDIVLTLSETQLTVPAGTAFDPLMLVAQAGSSEGNNDLMDRVQVENYVNAEIPGSYSVVYTLTSLDNTQQARAILRVTVTGGTS